MRVDIRVTGPCRLWVDSTEVALPPRQRQVLACLVLHGGDVATVEVLADALWGASVPRTGRKALQTHVAGLRSNGADLVRSVAGGYVLQTEQSGIDVHDFETSAQEMMRRDGRGEPGVVELAQRALSHWHGRPYLDIEDCERAWREQLRLDRLHDAVQRRRSAAMGLGASGGT